MKKQEVQVGANYIAKVSGKLAEVRITGQNSHGGWDAVNVATNKAVRIKSAQRLRAAAGKPRAKAEPKVDEPAKPEAVQRLIDAANRGDLAQAINQASAAELEEALKFDGWTSARRGRIEAAMKARTTPRPAEDVAKTVAAVEKGNLAEGVQVLMPAKKAAKAKTPKEPGKMSGLDAAAKVLAESSEPLNAKQIVEAMKTRGYWSSSAATPHATIYAAMITEIAKKGDLARFKKTDRGLFTVTMVGQAAGEKAK